MREVGESLRITPGSERRSFHISGELDLSNASQLTSALQEEAKGHGDITLDLSGLRFIDSSGIGVLLHIIDALDGRGRVVLRSPTAPVLQALSVTGLAGRDADVVVQGPDQAPPADPVSRIFPAEEVALREIRTFIRRRAAEDSFGRWMDSLVLAVSEASANSVLHSGSATVRISWKGDSDRAEIEVRDDGVFRRMVPADRADTGSRGLSLIVALMDQVSISCGTESRPGTVVRMVKYRDRNPASRRGETAAARSGIAS